MPMERNDFINPNTDGWWLTDDQLGNELENRRREMTDVLGTNDQRWFLQESLLLKLWDDMGSDRDRLLRELEEAAEDENKRLLWLTSVIDSLRVEEAQAAEKEEEEAPAPTQATQTNGKAPEPEKPRPNLFANKPAKKPQPSETAESESTESESSESQPAPSQSSQGNQTQASQGTQTQGQPTQAQSTQAESAAPESAETESSEDTPAPPPQITEAIQDKVDDLRSAASNPDIQISQKELDEFLADPAAQQELAKLLEEDDEAEIESEVDAEIERMTAETGA